jgi:flagellar motility protein MotE (MotC chaperone)
MILTFTFLFLLTFGGVLWATGALESRVIPAVEAAIARVQAVALHSPPARTTNAAPIPARTPAAPAAAPAAAAPDAALTARIAAGEDSLRTVRGRIDEQGQAIAAQGIRLAALEATVGGLLSAKEKEISTAWQSLARLFTAMRPEESARVVAYLPDAHAVRLLATMKPRDAARVMGLIDPERAARLSRQLGVALELAAAPVAEAGPATPAAAAPGSPRPKEAAP